MMPPCPSARTGGNSPPSGSPDAGAVEIGSIGHHIELNKSSGSAFGLFKRIAVRYSQEMLVWAGMMQKIKVHSNEQ
jgi:hypothetical protein